MPKTQPKNAALERAFGSDKTSEKNGVWVDYGPDLGIKVRRAGRMNKDYVRAFEKATRTFRKRERLGIETPPEQADKILRQVFAETIVIDWKGIDDPCTPENIVRYFEEYPDLFDDIRVVASGREIFTSDIKGDSGN